MVEIVRSKNSLKNEISMIPLINVVFLMLIFFMVAGNISKIDILNVDVPESATGSAHPPVPTTVYIDESGQMAVNDDKVAETDMQTILTTVIENNPRQEIVIKADSKTGAEKVIQLLDLIQKLGGENVSLITQARK